LWLQQRALAVLMTAAMGCIGLGKLGAQQEYLR
jgi:hypothetical protein